MKVWRARQFQGRGDVLMTREELLSRISIDPQVCFGSLVFVDEELGFSCSGHVVGGDEAGRDHEGV